MTLETLLAAMMIIESGGNPHAVGDGGRSIGPYQIQYAYWHDAQIPGRYSDCKNPKYARRVILAYWKRYCPQALKSRDFKTLARVHNGGPKGHKMTATLGYWNKVKMVRIK